MPVSTFLAPTGVGDMNMNVNLQMGNPGAFVGTPDKSQVAELKIKNYWTWQATNSSCNGNALPTPAPTGTPIAPPPVANDIVPHLQPYGSPVVNTLTTQRLLLPTAPPNGALVIAQGVSRSASCPANFTYTGFGDAFLCTGIVGNNGIVSSTEYDVGGAGFDRSAIVYLTGVTGYAINADTATGWHSEAQVSLTKSQHVNVANGLELAFGFDLTDSPRYPTSSTYTSNLPFNTIYQADGDANYDRGIAMFETNVDPISASNGTFSFAGAYTWTGTPATNGNNLAPGDHHDIRALSQARSR